MNTQINVLFAVAAFNRIAQHTNDSVVLADVAQMARRELLHYNLIDSVEDYLLSEMIDTDRYYDFAEYINDTIIERRRQYEINEETRAQALSNAFAM